MHCYLSQCFVSLRSTLDNNNTTTFSFVSLRYRCCIAIFKAQQLWFLFLIITLYYYEYRLGAETGNRTAVHHFWWPEVPKSTRSPVDSHEWPCPASGCQRLSV
jgi:hypothetical protein